MRDYKTVKMALINHHYGTCIINFQKVQNDKTQVYKQETQTVQYKADDDLLKCILYS